MKLEVGKSYVFKDDASKDEYIKNDSGNNFNVDNYYNDGFKLIAIDYMGSGYTVDSLGSGYTVDSLVIDYREIDLFKESEPFDISEYGFSDGALFGLYTANRGYIDIEINEGVRKIVLNKQDAEAIAKHFKLI